MIKFILIILDGFGLRKEEEGNAVAQANIPNLDVLSTQGANVYDILRRDQLVLTTDAVETLEARLK